jgi:hypothetical protein
MNRNPFAVLAIGLIMVIMYMERVTPAPTRQPQLSPWLCFGAIGLIIFSWLRMFLSSRPKVQYMQTPSPTSAPKYQAAARIVPRYDTADRIVPNLPPRWQGVRQPEYKWAQVKSENVDPETRRQVAMRISREYPWFPEYASILVKLTHDPDKKVRVAAVRALAHPRRGDLTALLEALSDEHLGVQLEAIKALRYQQIGGAPLVAILRGPERALHAAAADALGNKWGDEVVPALLEALGNTYTTVTRRKATRSLTKQRDVRGVDPLLKAIGDPNPNIRAAAARALRQLVEHLNHSDSGQASDSLRAGLNHPNPTVQLHAAYNLSLLGKPEGTAVLVGALTRTEAAPYLTKEQVQEALNRVGR